MDGTRARRTRDSARKLWYASQRHRRFARFIWGAASIQSPGGADRGARDSMSIDGTGGSPCRASLPLLIEDASEASRGGAGQSRPSWGGSGHRGLAASST